MDIGQLNCRVEIHERAAGLDDVGQPLETWTVLDTVWANVRQVSGLETIKGGHEASIVQASIRIRRRTDVTAAMRVVYDGTTFEILAVLQDFRERKFTDLVCRVAT